MANEKPCHEYSSRDTVDVAENAARGFGRLCNGGLRSLGDIDIGMDVRGTAEVTDERRAL